MKFLRVKTGEYIAVDTIGKIFDVKVNDIVVKDEGFRKEIKQGVSFSVETKRGDKYHFISMTLSSFQDLVGG